MRLNYLLIKKKRQTNYQDIVDFPLCPLLLNWYDKFTFSLLHNFKLLKSDYEKFELLKWSIFEPLEIVFLKMDKQMGTNILVYIESP